MSALKNSVYLGGMVMGSQYLIRAVSGSRDGEDCGMRADASLASLRIQGILFSLPLIYS